MAFHNRLSLTQRILLAIFCFPLLPFYLCYVCCCASEDKKDNDDSQEYKLEHIERGREDAVDGRSVTATVDTQPKPRTTSLQKSSPEALQEQAAQDKVKVTAEMVTVEIHPDRSTPKLLKRFSFGKGKEKKSGKEVRKNEVAYENKGFVDEDNKTGLGHKSVYAFPWDKSNLKSMCIDLDKFKHIDAYASKVKAGNTVEALVQEVLKGTKSDIEKLRAIWMWVTHHIEYDVEGLRNPGLRSCSPADVLRTGKGVCAGYAGLFQAMCSLAGIECQQVSGHSKGGSYKLGARFTGDATHAWNAVRLEGKWHLLDSTWGAGTVNDGSPFKFKYDEFYFLTHPALFVGDHFPLESQWQLLNPRLSLKQFEDAVHLRSSFYNLGLLSSHPKTSLIQADEKTTITIKSSSSVLFMHNLNGKQRNAIMMLTPDGMKLDIYPQEKQMHSLEIYGKAFNSGEEKKYTLVCEYQLQCRAVNREMRFPDDLSNPVGPSWLTERKGFYQPSQHNPIVHTADGRCSFRFRVESHLALMAMLSAAAFSMTDDEQRRHIFQSRQGEWVDFRVQVPRAGLYVFKVYAKDKAETGQYSYICNYLISCTNPKVRWPPYPLQYASWKEHYELVEPLSGVLPDNCVVQFKMRIPDVAQVSVGGRDTQHLVLDADGYWSGHCGTAGCTDLNVMIKVNPGDRSLSFVLNYQVESCY